MNVSVEKLQRYLAPVIFGLSAVFVRLHWREINPWDHAWIDNGDVANHYLGWLFFRMDEWRFPLGLFRSLQFPFGTTITQTDSIPPLALIFKLARSWLPLYFQYFGIWFLLCFTLQAFAADALARFFQLLRWERLAFVGLLTFSAVLFFRIGHAALCAHWLILYGLLGYFQRRLGLLLILVICATLIHPYLMAMTMTLALTTLAQIIMEMVGRDEKIAKGRPITFALRWRWSFALRWRWSFALRWLALFFGAVGVFGGALGYFEIHDPARAVAGYSADLLAFFNPEHLSRIFPTLRRGWGQYEGMGFEGAGSLLLFLVVVVQLGRRRELRAQLRSRFRDNRALVVALAGLTIFSYSSVVTFGGNPVLNLSWLFRALGPLPDIFRSCGRFYWVLTYALTIFSVVWSAKYIYPREYAGIILLLACGLQILDLTTLLWQPLPARAYVSSFRDPRWTSWAQGMHHLALLPPYFGYGDEMGACRNDSFRGSDFYDTALFAYAHGLTFNSGITSRPPFAQMESCPQVINAVRRGEFADGTLYLLTPTLVESLDPRILGSARWTCARLDSFTACRTLEK